MTPLTHSSWLAGTTYEPHTRRLTVHTRDGGALVHEIPPGEQWRRGLLHAHPSPGRGYNLLIKAHCPHLGTVAPPSPEPTDEDLADKLRASLREAAA